jgi:hypothetical protein
MTMNRWLRISKWFVSLFALSLLLLVAAWLVSNWNDEPPRPRPAALQLSSPAVSDDRNAYFAFAGLLAAADRDPSSAGQALWKLQLARAAATRTSPFAPATDRSASDVDAALGKAMPSLAGSPLICNMHIDTCVAQWIDNANALSKQHKEHALLGQRCERLLDGAFQFDEALAPMRTVAEPIAQHGFGAPNCSRWFLSGAVLAWAQQDPARAIALLTKADRMNRALLNGSHSLIGQMIAIRVTRNTLGTVAALTVRDPSLNAALMPLLMPLPEQVNGVKRWMVVEAAFQRGANDELAQSCLTESNTNEGRLVAWLCRHRIGWHPERNAQAIDAFWSLSIQQLNEELPAAIRAHTTEAAARANMGVFDGLTWKNTLGNMALSTHPPMYTSYLARHADLELHKETTTLALRAIAAGVPVAERRAWLAQQPVSPIARSRITWSDDGLVLVARAWQEPFGPGAYDAQRDAIRIVWPTSR